MCQKKLENDSLKQQSISLRQERDLLEQRVSERTAELKQLNEQLQEDIARRDAAEAALRQSEARFRNLFDHSLNGIALHEIITDAAGKPVDYVFLEVNRAFEALTGLPSEAVVNKRVSEAFPEAIHLGLVDVYGNVALTGEPVRFEQRFTSNRIYTIEVFSPQPRQFATIFENITQQKQAEEQKLELAVERERVAILQNFIGDMSHDLLTPLAVLHTTLYLLRKTKDPQKQQERIASLEIQVNNLESMIQDMLLMSRLDQSTEKVFTFIYDDLNTLSQRIRDLLLGVAVDRSQRLEIHKQPNLPPIYCDRDQLGRALLNLVDNALKYSPEGGSITIKTGQNDRGVFVEVRDNGSGIAPEDLPHIFERFYRGEKHRPIKGGTGLGLTIAQRIVQGHSGHIEVETTPGEGSIFRIVLPPAT